MVKTLEQRITDTYLESPWAKVSHISDVEDSDVKMHPLKGKEDQGDWVFKEADEEADKEADKAGKEAKEGEEADPSFVPLSPSAEPLDWGSDFDDGEVCVYQPSGKGVGAGFAFCKLKRSMTFWRYVDWSR